MKMNILRHNLFLMIIGLIVFSIGCAGQVEEKQEDPAPEMVKPPPPPKSLAPGRAIIHAQLLNIANMETHFNCIVKVEKVIGYGMSTKPIGNKTDLSLYISTKQTDIINFLEKGTSSEKYEFTLEQEALMDVSSSQSRWRVLKVTEVR